MQNVDKSKRIWKLPEVKDIFSKYSLQKPDAATWGDAHYVFAMMYSDYFPKVLRNESELVKATICYLEDPDVPDGTVFVRWLAVVDFSGDKINWRDFI